MRELNAWLRDYAAEAIDPRAIEEAGWVGDELIRDLGERGFCGLYVPEEYGGQGLSQTGYCRVFETIAQTDASLSVVLGVHQSIGYKGIALFGSDEQKARLLPDLAAGRRLAGFALTEPEAGSDAYNLQSRAVRQPDGSWRLNGEKRWIGNGSKGSVLVTFARAEVGGKDRHIASDRRARHGRLRGRQAVRHHGSARQRPAPPLLPRRAGAEGERARRAGRGLQDRHARAQQRPAQPRHGLGRRRQGAARRGHRPRQGAAPVRPTAG